MEVALDLLRSQRTLTHGLLNQVTIVTAVGGHFILGSWVDRWTALEGKRVHKRNRKRLSLEKQMMTDQKIEATVLL